MSLTRISLAIAFLALGSALAAQDASEYERFQLFTGCAPLELAVTVDGEEAEEIQLTEDRIRTMAESRLRAARIWGGGSSRPDMRCSS